MFTGIIQAVGRIRDNEEIGDGLRIDVYKRQYQNHQALTDTAAEFTVGSNRRF